MTYPNTVAIAADVMKRDNDKKDKLLQTWRYEHEFLGHPVPPNDPRPPNPISDVGIQRFLDYLENCVVSYTTQDLFIVAIIQPKLNPIVTFVGVSKRNPEDFPNQRRGRYLALVRAIRRAWNCLEKVL
jgi:hypothetical protein